MIRRTWPTDASVKTAAPLEVYIVLDVTFAHGTPQELREATGRAHHDVSGILFGETYDIPRQPDGDPESRRRPRTRVSRG